MDQAPPRSPRTTLTAVLILLVTVPFVLSAIDLWRVAFGGVDEQTTLRLIAYEWDPEDAGFFLQLAAVTMALSCAWALVVAAGVLARIEGFRMAGLLTFAALGIVSTMMALGGVLADERPDGWMVAVLVAAVNVTVALLLWSTEVSDDISRGAHERDRRRRDARRDQPAGDGRGRPRTSR